MNSKRKKVYFPFFLICLFVVSIAHSDSIVNSKHDLSYLLTTDPVMINVYNQYNEVCVYCHTPHSANTTLDAPLWNRNSPATTYNLYNSPTMDNPPGSVTGTSLACLGCHDGTIAVDEIINAPGPGANLGGPWYGTSNAPIHYRMNRAIRIPNCAFCHGGLGIYQPRAGDHRLSYLTTDLSDDHPISTTYPTNQPTQFNTIADGRVGTLPLFSGKVECASCHNVHNPSFTPFLRTSNSGSGLCMTCHIK